MTNKFEHKITSGWNRFGQYNNYLKHKKMPMCLKNKIMDTVILPVMTYGAEKWRLTNHQKQKLALAQRSKEIAMLDITGRDRVRKELLK
jgi:hypothetical protein